MARRRRSRRWLRRLTILAAFSAVAAWRQRNLAENERRVAAGQFS